MSVAILSGNNEDPSVEIRLHAVSVVLRSGARYSGFFNIGLELIGLLAFYKYWVHLDFPTNDHPSAEVLQSLALFTLLHRSSLFPLSSASINRGRSLRWQNSC